jgi:hypothetical protein
MRANIEAMTTHDLTPSLLGFFPNLRRGSGLSLSVYVPIRAEGFDARHYDLVFAHLVSRYRNRLGDEEREVLEREIPRVRAELGVVRPAGVPGLAAFADEPAGLLELIPLPAEVEPRLEVGPLLLAPVERLLERFPPALIAVVDKEEARAFGSVLGEMRPLDHLVGQDVKHHSAGGSSASSNQRKAENRAKANLTAVVHMIAREIETGSYKRLYLAGPDEARAELESLLPPALKRMVAGHLSGSLDSSHLLQQLREQMEGAPNPG